MEKQTVTHVLLSQKDAPDKVSRKNGHIYCPVCGHRQTYKLSDGRRQCKSCQRKFTPHGRKPRLSKEAINEIARLFWLLVPAARVAVDMGVNYNTVLKYYARLRTGISEQREREIGQLDGEVEVDESYFGGVRKGKRGRGAAGKIPVFGLLKRNGEVRVVFPKDVKRDTLEGAIRKHVKPQSWVYSDCYTAYDKLSVHGFHHGRVNHSEKFGNGKTHINGIENFWGFAKRRLKLYHGGYKKNFRLFIREMEFRFNHRNDDKALDYLTKLLTAGPN